MGCLLAVPIFLHGLFPQNHLGCLLAIPGTPPLFQRWRIIKRKSTCGDATAHSSSPSDRPSGTTIIQILPPSSPFNARPPWNKTEIAIKVDTTRTATWERRLTGFLLKKWRGRVGGGRSSGSNPFPWWHQNLLSCSGRRDSRWHQNLSCSGHRKRYS